MPLRTLILYILAGFMVYCGVRIAEGWTTGFGALLAVGTGAVALVCVQQGVNIWEQAAKDEAYRDRWSSDNY